MSGPAPKALAPVAKAVAPATQSALETTQSTALTTMSGALQALQRSAGNQAVFRLLEAGVSRERNGTPASVGATLTRGGRPLDPNIRAAMEARLGGDFAGVRVHDDPDAAASARLLGAHAYASGNDVVFASGRFAPYSETGRKLLTHELAHVLQSRDRSATLGPIIGPDHPHERVASRIANGASADLQPVSPGTQGIFLARDPRLSPVLDFIRAMPHVIESENIANQIVQRAQGIDLTDRENVLPIVEAIRSSFPEQVARDVSLRFLIKVEEAAPRRKVETEPSGPSAEEEARLQRRMAPMQIQRRGPYGQSGPGVLLPVISQAARPLLPFVEALGHGLGSAGALAQGVYDGLTTSIGEEQARQLSQRLIESSVLTAIFQPVFLSGATVGILEDGVEAIKGLYQLVTNFGEIASATIELVAALFSPDGRKVAHGLGFEIGREYAGKITALLKGNLVEFTFNLGRLIGPTIVYTVLSFLGVPQLIAAALATRLIKVLLPLLSRFPRLTRALERIAIRLGHTPRLGGVDPDIDEAVERSFLQTFRHEPPGPPPPPGAGVAAAGLTRAEVAAAKRIFGRRVSDNALLQRIWNDVANPGERATLTAANSRQLFDNHRNRFWRRVRRDSEARRMFEEAGFVFPERETTVPIFRDFERRPGGVSIDHIARRVDDPMRALDADNLRFVAIGDNTLLENLQAAIPALRQ